MISLTRFTHSQHTWGINAAGNDTYSASHIRPLMDYVPKLWLLHVCTYFYLPWHFSLGMSVK